jgi:hypothetical protein
MSDKKPTAAEKPKEEQKVEEPPTTGQAKEEPKP